jgi:F-type H+-transporting ATPase subunit b
MISINATLVVQIINLLVLIFILNKIMYKPIQAIMAQRNQKLEQDQAEVERIEKESLEAQAAYNSGLQQGRMKIRHKLADVRSETESRIKQILAEAQEKAKQRQAAVTAAVEEELARARKDIKAEAEKVAVSLASSVLGRGIS